MSANNIPPIKDRFQKYYNKFFPKHHLIHFFNYSNNIFISIVRRSFCAEKNIKRSCHKIATSNHPLYRAMVFNNADDEDEDESGNEVMRLRAASVQARHSPLGDDVKLLVRRLRASMH